MELKNVTFFMLTIGILICQAHSDDENENHDTEDPDEGNQPTARIFSNLFHPPGQTKPFHPPYPIHPFPDGGDFGNPLYPNNFEYLWYFNPGYGEQPIPAQPWYPDLYSNEE